MANAARQEGTGQVQGQPCPWLLSVCCGSSPSDHRGVGLPPGGSASRSQPQAILGPLQETPSQTKGKACATHLVSGVTLGSGMAHHLAKGDGLFLPKTKQ